jgi:hypothetical protein
VDSFGFACSLAHAEKRIMARQAKQFLIIIKASIVRQIK